MECRNVVPRIMMLQNCEMALRDYQGTTQTGCFKWSWQWYLFTSIPAAWYDRALNEWMNTTLLLCLSVYHCKNHVASCHSGALRFFGRRRRRKKSEVSIERGIWKIIEAWKSLVIRRRRWLLLLLLPDVTFDNSRGWSSNSVKFRNLDRRILRLWTREMAGRVLLLRLFHLVLQFVGDDNVAIHHFLAPTEEGKVTELIWQKISVQIYILFNIAKKQNWSK